MFTELKDEQCTILGHRKAPNILRHLVSDQMQILLQWSLILCKFWYNEGRPWHLIYCWG